MRFLAAFLLIATPALAAEHFDFGAPAAASAATRTVRVEIQGQRFVPSAVTVRAGETVRFDVVNTSDTQHEFVLGTAAQQKAHQAEMMQMAGAGSMDMDDDPNAVTIPPHAEKTLTWHFTRPATLEYACDIPGHYEAGMHGALTVSSR